MIDSTQIQDIVHVGLQIADNSNTTLIPNLPNNITSSLITIAVGLIIRFVEKHFLRKKGKLRDAD